VSCGYGFVVVVSAVGLYIDGMNNKMPLAIEDYLAAGITSMTAGSNVSAKVSAVRDRTVFDLFLRRVKFHNVQ
jgi:hypothetical protein